MKITSTLATLAAVTAAGSMGIIGSPLASADDLTTTTFGNQAKLTDGNVVQGWTVSSLKTSADVIPYAVAGTLWEATATDEAVQGGATPIVSDLNARARDGETYRVLFGVATPQGVNPATLAQGGKTTGKVYFDVTGSNPDSVVYIAGGRDLLLWIQPPPALPRASGGGSSSTSAPAGTPATPPPGTPVPATPVPGAPAGVTAPGAVLPSGSQGTPIPAGSQGTPATLGTPLAPGSQGTPLPGGSVGTPAPAGIAGAPQPAAVQPAPAVAGSQGTPLPASSPSSPAPSPAAPSTTVVVPPPA